MADLTKSFVNNPLDSALDSVAKKEALVVTADATDLATVVALCNELKAKINAMNAGLPTT